MPDSTVSRNRALQNILRIARPAEAVHVPPHEAVGLTATHDISAYCDVPEQACSVRDGYALRTADIGNAAPLTPVGLSVTQTVCAESKQAAPVKPGEAARVLTGGLVPPCADAVLAEEDVEIDGETIHVRTTARTGWFIRQAGGEIARNDVIVRAGTPITPQAAAVMIRTRVPSVQVQPAPMARVIALGSELSDPMGCGKECDTARFPADNLVMTSGLLQRSGVTVTETGVLPDIEGRLVEVLATETLPQLVLTSGGTGRSERDFARSSALEAGFEMLFDRVDIRPGRNMFAASKGETLLFGLPGPPAAVFACFHAMVLPVIRRLRGLADKEPTMARLTDGISARPGGQWLVPCIIEHRGADIIATPLASKATPPMLAIGLAHGVALFNSGESILPDGTVEVLSTQFE